MRKVAFGFITVVVFWVTITKLVGPMILISQIQKNAAVLFETCKVEVGSLSIGLFDVSQVDLHDIHFTQSKRGNADIEATIPFIRVQNQRIGNPRPRSLVV